MSEPQAVKKALVINDTERLLHYCETSSVRNTIDGREVEVPFHKAHALIPGCNVVDDDKWLAAFKESAVFKFHRPKGLVKILPMPNDKQGKATTGLLGFSSEDALEFVNKTFKLSLLEEWREAETRPEVVDALKKQHAYVKGELEAPEQEDRIMFKSPAQSDAGHMRI